LSLLQKPSKKDLKTIQTLAQKIHDITNNSGQPLYIIMRAAILETVTYLRWWREQSLPDKEIESVMERAAYVAEQDNLLRNQYTQTILLLLLSEMNPKMALHTLQEATELLRISSEGDDEDEVEVLEEE